MKTVPEAIGMSLLARKQWIAEAVKAGFKATKEGNRTELKKDGWNIWVEKMDEEEGGICGWGPDGMQIIPPPTFSMPTLKRRLKVCLYCKRTSKEPIKKIGFAGRACPPCYKANVGQVEFPGWTN